MGACSPRSHQRKGRAGQEPPKPGLGVPAPLHQDRCTRRGSRLAAPVSSQPAPPDAPGRASHPASYPCAHSPGQGRGGGLGIPGGRPGRVYPWGPLRQRAPKGCAQPKYYIESPSWVEKGSWGCNDAPCSEPHPSGRTVMLRIPSALASHAFYSVPC